MIAATASYSYVTYSLKSKVGFVSINIQPTGNLPAITETTCYQLPDDIKDIANSWSAAPIANANGYAIIRAGGLVNVSVDVASRPRVYSQINFFLQSFD